MSVAPTAPTAAVPAHALRRGTRGFGAVVLFLTGMIVSAVTLFVLPAAAIDRIPLTFLIVLAIAFSIAHFVAMYGLIRRRQWAAPLTLYLAAIGLGLVAFGALLLATGFDPLGRPGADATFEARVQVVGLLLWLFGSWIVAAWFAVRGMAPPDRAAEPAGAEDTVRALGASPQIVAAPSA